MFCSFQGGDYPREICDLLLDDRSLQDRQTSLAQVLFGLSLRLFPGGQVPLGDTRIGTTVRMALGNQRRLAFDCFQTVRNSRIEETIIE
jgi:hypothetical protein